MTLLNILPDIHRAYDKKSGNVLQYLMAAFDNAVEQAKKEIEDFPNLIDLESCPDELLPYLLKNLANPFPTEIIDFSKKSHNRWIIGYTEIGEISDIREESDVKLNPASLRNLGGQLFEIYKRKGTKLGAIMACRAVALAEVFIADWWTDSAATFRHGTNDRWILGETQLQTITDEPVFDDSPFCEICEGDKFTPDYSDSYGVPEAQTSDLSVTISNYEDFEIYDNYIIFEINLSSEYRSNIGLHIQYSESGGFIWQNAKGWITSVASRPQEWWTIGETSLNKITDRKDILGKICGLTPGKYYFIFDPISTGISSHGLRWMKFRAIPFSENNIMGTGEVTDPFQYIYGSNTQVVDANIIPAIISDYSYQQQHWVIGETPFGIITDVSGVDFNQKRKAQFHFEVIIISKANETQKKLIREIIDYIKPAHTHWTLIEGNELKSSHGAWVIGETKLGTII
ncbi:MAG: hypothetical protein KA807_15705 [Prolixibacteraceae bacterium]|nr:hypothetical protein [Prolixibacteraceae bacterium]